MDEDNTRDNGRRSRVDENDTDTDQL